MTSAGADAPLRSTPSVSDRVDRIDWVATAGGLDDVGVSPTGPVLSVAECRSVAGLYDDEERSNAPMRLGVGTVHSGRRHMLGLVFHDALRRPGSGRSSARR